MVILSGPLGAFLLVLGTALSTISYFQYNPPVSAIPIVVGAASRAQAIKDLLEEEEKSKVKEVRI